LLGGVFAAGLLAGCAGSDASSAVTSKKASDYYCAPDPLTVHHIAETLASADEDDYQDAIRFSIAVPPGTKVRILKRVDDPTPAVEVDVLEGEYKGHQCWYPSNVAGVLTGG
jgi:hypothetical protein